ncbi:MAG: hypothetical protein JRI22_11260 [Deltaproteobacteria bacterium]|nr:hypothetical protein [Deltaproteobacteria bacterium]
MKRAKRIVALVWITALSVAFLTGCQHFRGKESGGETAPPAAPVATGPVPIYYDFKDVLIPGDLKLNAKRRSVYMDDRVVAGVLFFEGRVDARSLAAFFEEKMPQDGWRLINTFRQRKDYQLSFQKERAFCQVTIYDKPFTTEVEIRRTPIFPPVEPMGAGTGTAPVSPPAPAAEEGAPKAQPLRIQPIR